MQTTDRDGIKLLAKFANFFGLKRNLVILLIAIFVIGSGEELWMRFIPKYLQALGASVFVIGLYDALRTLLSAVYALPGGAVADLWGHRRAFLIFNLVSIAGYALVLLVPHWAAVIAGMFLFLSWSCFSLPATLSLVGTSLAANRHSMGVGVQMVIRRLPIMIAPIFGGILIDHFGLIPGVHIALAISILLAAGTLFVQWRHDREGQAETPRTDVATTKPLSPVSAVQHWNLNFRSFNRPLRRLLLSDILVRFCERIPYPWVVIFAMDYIGVSARGFGILTTVEMLAATICIIPTSYFADRSKREPFVIATFVLFTLFPLVLLGTRSYSVLLFAFLIRGLKEFGDTSRKALIIEYSGISQRGQMIGTYYLVRDLIVSAGALVGAYLWRISPRLNFLGAAIFGIVGTIYYVRTIRSERRESLEELKEELAKSRRGGFQ
jgi:MFS family permease